MPNDPLTLEELPAPKEGSRVLRLTGPLLISNLFDFQAKVRADKSKALVLDMANVPYIDSAGIGALVGAYVSRQHDNRSLILVGVPQRVRQALEVTRVDQFFTFAATLAEVA